MIQILRTIFAGAMALMLVSCATNDNPPCRKVIAEEFMRPHTFKGVPTDRFIGVTSSWWPRKPAKPDKAFKTIWQMGLAHDWAVIWCPASELPSDYLKTAREKPNRKLPGTSDFVHE